MLSSSPHVILLNVHPVFLIKTLVVLRYFIHLLVYDLDVSVHRLYLVREAKLLLLYSISVHFVLPFNLLYGRRLAILGNSIQVELG